MAKFKKEASKTKKGHTTSRQVVHQSKAWWKYAFFGVCVVAAATPGICALVEQSTKNEPYHIRAGDSVTITSKNAKTIFDFVKPRLDHTYVPRYANFGTKDITVNQANNNKIYNDGDQIYFDMIGSFADAIIKKQAGQIEVRFWSTKWLTSDYDLRNGYIDVDGIMYNFEGSAADFNYIYIADKWDFQISPTTPSDLFPTSLTYASDLYDTYNLRVIPTTLDEESLYDSVDYDNIGDANDYITAYSNYWDNQEWADALKKTTFPVDAGPILHDGDTSFNDYIDTFCKNTSDAGNGFVKIDSFKQMMYLDINRSVASVVSTGDAQLSTDAIPGFWLHDKEHCWSQEETYDDPAAPFFPDTTRETSCRFDDASFYLRNDIDPSSWFSGSSSGHGSNLVTPFNLGWYPESTDYYMPQGEGYMLRGPDILNVEANGSKDEVWFTQTNDNGVATPIYVDYYVRNAPENGHNDNAEADYYSYVDSQGITDYSQAWIVMRGFDKITHSMKTIYLPSCSLANAKYSDSLTNGIHDLGNGIGAGTDIDVSWDSGWYFNTEYNSL